MSGNEEKETLYINNLNEKIKIDDMKNSLNELFSKYGEILDIKIHNTIRLKGQAFISYKNLEDAKKAQKEINKMNFLGKIINVNFAKCNSDKILLSKNEMTTKEKEEKDLQRKRKRDEFYKDYFNKLKETYKKFKEDEINNQVKQKNDDNKNEKKTDEKINNIIDIHNLPTNSNNLLFVEGLSNDFTEEKLKKIFSKDLNGLIEVRLFKNKGICFVEYNDEINSTLAMNKLNKLSIYNCTLNISYAKK